MMMGVGLSNSNSALTDLCKHVMRLLPSNIVPKRAKFAFHDSQFCDALPHVTLHKFPIENTPYFSPLPSFPLFSIGVGFFFFLFFDLLMGL